MKFCYNTNFTLPKHSQGSRSVSQDGSRSLGLFWNENTSVLQPKKYGICEKKFLQDISSFFLGGGGGHMLKRFFRSNRPGYPHPVSSELENSGIRVAVGDCSVTERRRWRPPYQTSKTVQVHAKITNTTRTEARRRVCVAMVPYR